MILLLATWMLSACTADIPRTHLEAATAACEKNGGVQFLRVIVWWQTGKEVSSVSCADGAKFDSSLFIGAEK
jgi:hypothetical protein